MNKSSLQRTNVKCYLSPKTHPAILPTSFKATFHSCTSSTLTIVPIWFCTSKLNLWFRTSEGPVFWWQRKLLLLLFFLLLEFIGVGSDSGKYSQVGTSDSQRLDVKNQQENIQWHPRYASLQHLLSSALEIFG